MVDARRPLFSGIIFADKGYFEARATGLDVIRKIETRQFEEAETGAWQTSVTSP